MIGGHSSLLPLQMRNHKMTGPTTAYVEGQNMRWQGGWAGSRNGYKKGPKKKRKGGYSKANPVLSALALLSFLFFLNILQTSIKDNMTTTPQPPTAFGMLRTPTRGQMERTQDPEKQKNEEHLTHNEFHY